MIAPRISSFATDSQPSSLYHVDVSCFGTSNSAQPPWNVRNRKPDSTTSPLAVISAVNSASLTVVPTDSLISLILCNSDSDIAVKSSTHTVEDGIQNSRPRGPDCEACILYPVSLILYSLVLPHCDAPDLFLIADKQLAVRQRNRPPAFSRGEQLDAGQRFKPIGAGFDEIENSIAPIHAQQ